MVLPKRVGKADRNGPLPRRAPDSGWPVSCAVRVCNCDFSLHVGHEGGTEQGKRMDRKTPQQHVVAQVSSPVPLPRGGFSRSQSGWKREDSVLMTNRRALPGDSSPLVHFTRQNSNCGGHRTLTECPLGASALLQGVLFLLVACAGAQPVP